MKWRVLLLLGAGGWALVVNPKATKAQGIAMPPVVLVRADRVLQ